MRSVVTFVTTNGEAMKRAGKLKVKMTTIEKIKAHASEIIAKGAPFTKEELRVLKIFNSLNAGKAFNSGKRNAKAENQRLISGK